MKAYTKNQKAIRAKILNEISENGRYSVTTEKGCVREFRVAQKMIENGEIKLLRKEFTHKEFMKFYNFRNDCKLCREYYHRYIITK